jgi:hypothetical protein
MNIILWKGKTEGRKPKSEKSKDYTQKPQRNCTRRVGESFFDYEYLCEFEAKIGTARKVV